ncbi:MAG: hypothetical protein ACR2LY_04155 [Thermoleophilaceae bacterium]
MRRILVIALLTLAGAALLAPASAQAQSQQDVECFVDAAILTDPGGRLEAILQANPDTADAELEKALDDRIREIEDCIGNFFPGMDRDFCDDCDPTFDFEEIRRIIIRFDRGRALRQRLLECRDRRLNKTQSDDSRRDCRGLEAVFELYVNDEASLEARRRSDGRPIGSDPGPEPANDPAAAARRGLAVTAPSPQRTLRGLRFTCRPPAGGLCRVEVLARGIIVARGARSVPAGATATLRLRPTRRGNALVARRGRVRAKVIVRVPGAFTVRTVTLTR